MSNNRKENIRLMIIDDDADDRKFFIEAVKEIDENIECLWAKDGFQALENLRNESLPLPDYIFLDLRMPRINGKKCLLEIKADARLQHIPVIIYTTSRELEESQELKDLGAVHFISKPTNPEEIYYVVSCVLEEQMWQPGLKP
jgi:DNA-binding response OmpR family regulator